MLPPEVSRALNGRVPREGLRDHKALLRRNCLRAPRGLNSNPAAVGQRGPSGEQKKLGTRSGAPQAGVPKSPEEAGPWDPKRAQHGKQNGEANQAPINFGAQSGVQVQEA